MLKHNENMDKKWYSLFWEKYMKPYLESFLSVVRIFIFMSAFSIGNVVDGISEIKRVLRSRELHIPNK